jgi:hypothetical protein
MALMRSYCRLLPLIAIFLLSRCFRRKSVTLAPVKTGMPIKNKYHLRICSFAEMLLPVNFYIPQ